MAIPPSPEPFGALLLAGGRSSRMGRDKASLAYRSVPLLTHMKRLAGAAGAAPVLVSGGPAGDLPDPLPGAGPAAGLCALADHARGRPQAVPHGWPYAWIVLPVDMPLLGPSLLRRLAATPGRAAHFAGQPLPLMLRLEAETFRVADAAKARLLAGESVALHRMLADLGAAALAASAAEQAELVNANTPDAWQNILAAAAQEPGGRPGEA